MMRAPAAIVLGLLSGMMAPAGRAQNPPPVFIHGRVLADDTGDPLRNARVGATGGDVAPVLTDADGRFAIARPHDGRGALSAAKTGYVKATAQVTDNIDFRLTRAGIITGHVLDDAGSPLPLIRVVAQRVVRSAGHVTFETAGGTEADDRGEYRIFGLAPGEYVVATAGARDSISPGPADERPLSHYYSNAATAESAQVIRVSAGAEAPGIDILIALPEPGPQFPRSTAGPARASLGRISGRIVNADGLPARLRRVALESADGAYGPYLAVTDRDGRYELRNLPAGAYRLSAGDLGAAPVVFGQQRPSDRGTVITVKAGEIVDGIDVTLPRATVIAGRVVDEYGEPMENAGIRIHRIAMVRGRRSLVTPPGPTSTSTFTNDLGRYRLSGLPPGRYVLSAAVGQTTPPRGAIADWPGYARTYFPGTVAPGEAQQVEIAAGQDVLNADIALIRERGARISGTATTAAGAPFQGQVSLAPSIRSGALSTPPLSVRTGVDGRFAFEHLLPGEYVLQAAAPRGSVWNEGEFAARFVTLNGDNADDVAIRLSAGSTVEGRFRFEGGDPPDDPEVRLSAIPVDPDLAPLTDDAPARADVHDDLSFRIAGLNGPRRLQLTHAPDGWALKQVVVHGGDATDAPLMFGTADQSLRDVEVVLTKRLTSLTATVRDAAGHPADFRVIAFAATAAMRYPGSRFFGVAVPDRDATATFRGLPPGEYYVVALARPTLGQATAVDGDAEFLDSLVAAATFTALSDDQPVAVTVTLVSR